MQLILKMSNKGSGSSRAALTWLLDSIPAHLRRSITYNNGSDSVEHQDVKRGLRDAVFLLL